MDDFSWKLKVVETLHALKHGVVGMDGQPV